LTKILTANIGSYPRIGELKDQQRHRRGLGHFQNHEISAHAFRDVEQSVIQEVIREQILLGLDEITNGLVPWQDPISHFCSKLTGIEIGGLTRYFDANFYYRMPLIKTRPKRKAAMIVEEFQFAQGASEKPVRSILTGPVTLALCTGSTAKAFDKLAARADLFTEILIEEVKALEAAGATHIQLDEPGLAAHPEHFALVKKSVSAVAKSLKSARLSLAVYFGSCLPVFEGLVQLPIYSLNVDTTCDSKNLLTRITKTKPGVVIGLGVIDGRNTRLEPIDPLLNWIRAWLPTSGQDVTYLTPSCGLEFLPRDHAAAKLKLLNRLKQELLAEPASPSVHA
jgi:5-methyltetrahydropteroyltriglutamate--homocysteine methyltransferase